MILPGSYANGFAPRDGQPLYPELWRGCVGAWAPCLGPTGLTLRDWSGLHRHATFSGITSDSAWVILQRNSLTISNLSTQFLSVDSNGYSGASGTMACWVRKTASVISNRDYMIWSKVTSSSNKIIVELETYDNSNGIGNNPQITAAFATTDAQSLTYNPSVSSLDTWIHVGLTWQVGQPLRLWINGRNTGSSPGNFSAQSETSVEYWGNYPSSSFGFGGQLNDMRRYNRVITATEMQLLASRIGIAYELAPRRRASSGIAFNRRRRLLVGAGS